MTVPAAQPLVISNSIFFSLAVIATAMRVYTRQFMVHTFGIDDVFAILAIIAYAGLTALHMVSLEYGLGQHAQDLTERDITLHAKCMWGIVASYNLALTLTKTSIVLQYMRVFRATKIQWICKALLAIVVVYGCWSVLGSIFMCWPISFFWEAPPTDTPVLDAGGHPRTGVDDGADVVKGKCLNKLAFWFSNAALNIVTDILITVAPLPFLKGLKVSTRQKMALIGVFCVGSLVFIMSCIRLKGLYTLSLSPDPTYDAVSVAVWSNIEVGLAIICAAVPPLKPFLARLVPGLLSSQGNSAPHNTYARGVSMGYGRQTSRNDINGDDNDSDLTAAGPSSPTVKKGGIHVHQTITLGSEKRRASNAQSDECELVTFKTDCYPASRGSNDMV